MGRRERKVTVRQMSLSVFLCHASGDKERVRELYQNLQNDGFDPWLDEENLLPGHDWEQEMARVVMGSDVVWACLSEDCVTKSGYVEREMKIVLGLWDLKVEGSVYIYHG